MHRTSSTLLKPRFSVIFSMKHPDQHQAMGSTVPEWICTKLGKPAEGIARLLVDMQTSSCNYNMVLDYISHRGVNIGEQVPSPPDLDSLGGGPVTEETLNVRECNGELSNLIFSPDDTYDYAKMLFGLGSAHIRHDDEDVFAVHVQRGAPVGTGTSASIYRELHLYAKSAEVLRGLSNIIVRWHHLRQREEYVSEEGTFDLYTLKFYPGCDTPEWESRGPKLSRSLDSVILPDSMLQRIVSDIREFDNQSTRDWYARHGLPYRRSYLFHGKPGTGKTSTVRALAGALSLSACFLSLGDRRIGNPELQSVLSDLPSSSILVIEDIDALFNENRKSDNPSPLTFSGLLNALDGLISEDGTITIMTTNHIERLDPALIRAGRVDRKFEFKPPTQEMMAKYFKSFYPDATDAKAKEFAELAFERPEPEARSLATLQEHFIYTRGKTPEECVEMLDEFFTEFYPGIKEMNRLIQEELEKEKAKQEQEYLENGAAASSSDSL